MKKKLCDTCIYRNNVEQLKPCIIYRDDCEYYESDEDMSEVGVEIVKTEESEENRIKYLNINVSNSEVERNPDIVRLCADAGILEYVKPKTGNWITLDYQKGKFECSECHTQGYVDTCMYKPIWEFCPRCGAKMVKPQESEDN